jgi:uncharacterized protein (TIGR04255 family)
MHSPPIYVIGMVRFPKVPTMGQFIDQFMDKIRHEYPLTDRGTSQILNTNLLPGTIQFERQETILWQFTSIERSWGFVLTDEAFCLHTNSYQHFDDFVGQFQRGLSALIDIPSIDIAWLLAVGLRFVNMVVPMGDQHLANFADSWVMPVEPSQILLKIIESVYVARYKTQHGELRLQTLRNPPLTLPPELNTTLVQKNGWVQKKPEGEFALIDLDHILGIKDPIQLDLQSIGKYLLNLRNTTKEIVELANIAIMHQI